MRNVFLLTLALTGAVYAYPTYPLGKRQDLAIIDIPSPVEHTGDVSACQGYRLVGDATTSDSGLDALLELVGDCSAYGPDYPRLRLQVRYETDDRVRVRIVDEQGKGHVVPTGESYSIGQWKGISDLADTTTGGGSSNSNLRFSYTPDPFSFSVTRKLDDVTLFNTTGHALIFEEQYLRLTTSLNGGTVQGLGQHNDNLSLPIELEDYTRTIWTRDAYGLPYLTNLYGAHPVYVSQLPPSTSTKRLSTSHGVFLLNSHGMDIKFPSSGQQLEYNILGGILDLFVFNGPTPGEVIRQYTEVIGRPAEVPYWSLGFHQCRYGTNDIVEAAETVANYSAAGIPLEIQWLDIDYMYQRWIMTLDPDRFELAKVRYFVETLRERGQRFIVMVDPAVASGRLQDDMSNYTTLQDGLRDGVFFKNPRTNETYEGVVWPGPTVFPDFTSQVARDWWTSEFASFFNPSTGVDIAGIWLDMNEPASFQPYLEANVDRISKEREVPPVRPPPRVLDRTVAGFEAFRAGQNVSVPFTEVPEQRRAMLDQVKQKVVSRQNIKSEPSLADTEDPSLDSQWLYPPYRIQDRRAPPSSANSDGTGLKNISDFTVRTDVMQSNQALMYAEHNLYGALHGLVTREALIARKPTERPFIIARSSFSGTGTHNGNWLGDSYSNWDQYSNVIRQMLQFASFGSPIVGADTGGFGGNCTETLLARWAWLGAFNTFYRNHNELGSIGQEFYRYPLSTVAGKAAIQTRLRLLDYIYTFIHKAHVDGTPAMWPLSWVHPEDNSTYPLEHQFYFGPALLVSPVIAENSTTVSIYLPNATYYDFFDLTPVQGNASQVILEDVGYETIPLHILGGNILPLRTGAANTTAQNHELPFHVVVAPNATGQAYGELRLDDGISLDTGSNFSDITMTFSDNSRLEIAGTFGFQGAGQLDLVVFAGQASNKTIKLDGQVAMGQTFDPEHQTLTAWGLGLTFGKHVVTLE